MRDCESVMTSGVRRRSRSPRIRVRTKTSSSATPPSSPSRTARSSMDRCSCTAGRSPRSGRTTGHGAGRTRTVIDAAGKFVMPGIIDTHSHTAVEGSVNEISLPNTGMVRIRDVLTNEDIDVYRQLAGGTTTALVLHGSANAIGGQSPDREVEVGTSRLRMADRRCAAHDQVRPRRESEVARTSVRRRAAARSIRQTRMGVEEVIRQSFTDAQGLHGARGTTTTRSRSAARPRFRRAATS